ALEASAVRHAAERLRAFAVRTRCGNRRACLLEDAIAVLKGAGPLRGSGTRERERQGESQRRELPHAAKDTCALPELRAQRSVRRSLIRRAFESPLSATAIHAT